MTLKFLIQVAFSGHGEVCTCPVCRRKLQEEVKKRLNLYINYEDPLRIFPEKATVTVVEEH